MQRFALKYIVPAIAVIFVGFTAMQAQNKEPQPTLVVDNMVRETPVVQGNNLYCAGYITRAQFDTSLEIVGSDEEAEARHFDQNDFIYIRGGAARGLKVDDEFSIFRPRGKAHSNYSHKNNLGVYTQELGLAKIVEVKRDVAVAQITLACDDIMLGDLLTRSQQRVSPLRRPDQPMERFNAPNGKSIGRIVLARDGQESLT